MNTVIKNSTVVTARCWYHFHKCIFRAKKINKNWLQWG